MRIELSVFIEGDLDTIATWIAQDNPARAVTFLQEIRVAVHRVGENPYIYRLRPEIGEEARISVVDKYLILFRIVQQAKGEVIRIERIVFGGRDLPELMR